MVPFVGVLVPRLSNKAGELCCFLKSKSDEVALTDSVSQWERRRPAASHRGNNSGPLVLLRGFRELAGAGGRTGYIISLTEGVFP